MKFKFYAAICLKDEEIEGVTFQVPYNDAPELTDEMIDSLVVNHAEEFGEVIGKEIIMVLKLKCETLNDGFLNLNLKKLKKLADEEKAEIMAINDFKIKYLGDFFGFDETEHSSDSDSILKDISVS